MTEVRIAGKASDGMRKRRRGFRLDQSSGSTVLQQKRDTAHSSTQDRAAGKHRLEHHGGEWIATGGNHHEMVALVMGSEQVAWDRALESYPLAKAEIGSQPAIAGESSRRSDADEREGEGKILRLQQSTGV